MTSMRVDGSQGRTLDPAVALFGQLVDEDQVQVVLDSIESAPRTHRAGALFQDDSKHPKIAELANKLRAEPEVEMLVTDRLNLVQESLTLPDSGVDQQIAKPVFALLRFESSLRSIGWMCSCITIPSSLADLSGNELCDDDIKRFSKCCWCFPHLLRLNIACNRFTLEVRATVICS